MITNTPIPLGKDSEIRQNAKNLIEYTVLQKRFKPIQEKHFGTPSPISDSSEQQISDDRLTEIIICIENASFDLCTELLPSDVYPYSFFGTQYAGNRKVTRQALISDTMIFKGWDTTKRRPNFIQLLLNDSVFHCYHALLTELLSYTENAYISAGNVIQNKGGGFDSLKTHLKMRSFKENKEPMLKISRRSYANSYKEKIGNSSNFNRTVKRVNEMMGQRLDLMVSQKEGVSSSLLYSIQFSPIAYLLSYIDPPVDRERSRGRSILDSRSFLVDCYLLPDDTPNNISPKKTEQKNIHKSFIDSISTIYSILCSNAKTAFKSLTFVDKIYASYILNRILGLDSFFYLCKNLEEISKTKGTDFFGLGYDQYSQEILSQIFNFPNTFTAGYLIRYPFEFFGSDTVSFLDYWDNMNIYKNNILGEKSPSPKGFQYDYWLMQFKAYIDYLTNFIEPIIDWCFLINLMEYVERCEPDSSHIKHLELGLSILSAYIRDNAKDLICPFELSDSKSVETVSTDVWGSANKPDLNPWMQISSDIDSHAIFQLYLKRDFDLNLKPLDLGLFELPNEGKFLTKYYSTIYFNPILKETTVHQKNYTI
ncbi:MAG: hypothetical protein IJT16_00135 [Lachnospiraceae bacterium]|nr:hypothetical protein [Lachnospiraceae bacterium]